MCRLFKWNENVYSDAERLIKEQGKCCVVIGTCLGKTTTALEYLEKHNCKGLVLAPNLTIVNNWLYDDNGTRINDNIDAMTYISFYNVYSTFDYSKYGLVICDEAHHLAAEHWGEAINYILENSILPVMGLTATNVRSDFDDVAESIFSGCKAEGLDVLSGIRQGILNGVKYVNAYYETEKIKEEFSDVSDEVLLKKLNIELNNTETVKNIILQNMPNRKIKGIIYVSDIEQMSQAEKLIKDIYPNIECRKIHSILDDNQVNRDWFRQCAEGFILTVNMINEGSHYQGVNTEIMFRNTSSSVLYYQQIGRVLSLTKNGNPESIIFDFVNNNKTISLVACLSANRDIQKALRSGRQLTDDEIKALRDEIPEQLIIDDRTEKLDNILTLISYAKIHPWNQWEDDIIINDFPENGADKCTFEINSNYDGMESLYRKKGDIQSRANLLGVKLMKYWTDEKIDQLKELYSTTPNKELEIIFEGHDFLSQAFSLGLKKKKRPLRCIELDRIYLSCSEAEQDTGVKASLISAVLNKAQILAGGYHWIYLDDLGYKEYVENLAELMGCNQKQERGSKHKKQIKNIETNEIFNGLKEAEIKYNTTSICYAIKSGKTAAGYHWQYIN